ncbi:MAG TPA: hypothetical protein VGB17_09455 [Pyrinomonadaceae bacterium]|jgi:hypothetical protein
MQRRRIEIEGERYLIFYTFEDEGAEGLSTADADAGRVAEQAEPPAEPQTNQQAGEERHV